MWRFSCRLSFNEKAQTKLGKFFFGGIFISVTAYDGLDSILSVKKNSSYVFLRVLGRSIRDRKMIIGC